MAFDMTSDETRAFLLEGTRTGKLASTMPQGSPHVMPIWFLLDGDDLVFTTAADTVKGRHILSDGRVSVCVDDERPPFAFVHIRGRATGTLDDPALLDWATRIAQRYMGSERAREYGERTSATARMLVRLTPERVIAKAGLAD